MSQTATDFLTRCFAPGETIALLLRSESADRPAQRIVRLEQALAPAYIRWLAHQNHAGANVYVAANPLRSGSRRRTKECIASVRHLYIDIQQEIYSLIEDQFRRIMQDYDSWRDKIDALKRGKPIRLLQAAANPSLLNGPESTYQLPRYTMPNPTLMQRLADYKHHEYPSRFVTAKKILKGIIADPSTGQKAVCWSNFVRNLDQFSENIRTELGIPVFQIDGRVPASEQSSQDQSPRNADIDETREQIIDRFLSTSGPAILVTNPASTSESISLHSSCHNAILTKLNVN